MVRDAPSHAWTVVQVVPDDLTGHRRSTGTKWCAVLYEAKPRADGLHMWHSIYRGTPCASEVRARTVGRRDLRMKGVEEHGRQPDDLGEGGGLGFKLAPRLADIVRNPSDRAAVRLGQGREYVLLAKHTMTSRGGRVSYMLGRYVPNQHFQRPTHEALRDVTVLHRVGRVNDDQHDALERFALGFGILPIVLSWMPRTGAVIPNKRLPPPDTRLLLSIEDAP